MNEGDIGKKVIVNFADLPRIPMTAVGYCRHCGKVVRWHMKRHWTENHRLCYDKELSDWLKGGGTLKTFPYLLSATDNQIEHPVMQNLVPFYRGETRDIVAFNDMRQTCKA